MPRHGVFSVPYFPVFGLNTGKYGPEDTPYLNTFHSVLFNSLVYTYLHLLIHTYVPLYYYTNLIKLINMGNIEITKKFSRLKSVSSIDDDYLETATGSVL